MPTAEEILRKFKGLKTIPAVATRVAHLVSSEEASIREFEEIIRLDPVLVSRLLRLVNSSYFGLLNKVGTIGRALVFIGIKNLRNLVMVESLKDVFKGERKRNGFSRKKLWMHCTGVGICCQLISRRLYESSGEDSFLAGILHDFGMIMEDQIENESFLKAVEKYRKGNEPLPECEYSTIGTDHCTLASLLAREWKFPHEVQKVIQNHHKEIQDPLEIDTLLSIIQVAHYLVDGLGYSEIDERTEEPKGLLAEHIRLKAIEYKVLAEELPGELEKANELYE